MKNVRCCYPDYLENIVGDLYMTVNEFEGEKLYPYTTFLH